MDLQTPREPAEVLEHLRLIAPVLAGISFLFALIPVPWLAVSWAVRVAVTWPLIMLGPLGGWGAAILSHHLAGALGLLLSATVACTIPLGVYVATRAPEWLGVACIPWAASGWYFAVGMWV
jgi:hypothetical protein